MSKKDLTAALIFTLALLLFASQTGFAAHCNVDPPTYGGPEDGSTTDTLTPFLNVGISFSPTDGTCQYLQTFWQIATDSDFENLVYDVILPDPSIQVPQGVLSVSTTYYWRVSHEIREVNEGQRVSAPYYEYRSFTTPFIFIPIEVPECNWPGITDFSPGDGDLIAEVRPTISVTKANFVIAPACEHNGSEWEIASDSNFQDIHVRFGNANNLTEFSMNSSLARDLESGQRYYWRVKFEGPGEIESDWYGPYSFSVLSSQRVVPIGGEDPIELPDPQPVGSTLSAFDVNRSCVLDDNEFFNIVDQWIAAQINDLFFFDAVDAWIGQIDICIQALSLANSVQLKISAHQIQFESRDQSISSIEIYDTSGQSIRKLIGKAQKLSWNLRNVAGQPIANGIYFYREANQLPDGSVILGEFRKLIVMR